MAVCERYRYTLKSPLSMPISAFGGISDGELTGAALEAWAEQTTGRFRQRMLPGEHLFYREAGAVCGAPSTATWRRHHGSATVLDVCPLWNIAVPARVRGRTRQSRAGPSDRRARQASRRPDRR